LLVNLCEDEPDKLVLVKDWEAEMDTPKMRRWTIMSDPASDDANRPWKLLQQGHFAEALETFQDQYRLKRGPGRKRGLGEALMWARDYHAAASHFQDAIDRDARHRGYNASSEENFAFLGAAEWCSGDYEAAIKAWNLGIKAAYSIGGCRTHCPLLLFLASILRPSLYERDRAEKTLLKRLNSRSAKGYPASEARFALGLIDKHALEASWPATPPLNVSLVGEEAEWTRDFYEAVRHLAAETNTIEDARLTWRSLSERTRYESADVEIFYSIVCIPEFFIAGHEAKCSPVV
jgi:tetratricopeptide (TPR) repeat protein